MKTIITCFLLSISLVSNGQTKASDSLININSWIESYYKRPNPDSLYYIYCSFQLSKENSSEEPNIFILGFISSAIKNDSDLINQFYQTIRFTNEISLIKSFAWILWYINSEYTLELLSTMANEIRQEKMKDFLIQMRNREPLDISTLGLSQPILLWSDFFATGSQMTMNSILSKIDNYESQKWIEKQVAINTVNSIRYYSKRDRNLIEYMNTFMQTSKEPTTKILKEIISEIE